MRLLRQFLFATLSLSIVANAQNARFERKVINVDGNAFAYPLAIGDLNEDGVPDLVTVTTSGNTSDPQWTLRILLSNGPASYNSAPLSYSLPKGLNDVAVKDLNNDGHLDVFGDDGDNIYVF